MLAIDMMTERDLQASLIDVAETFGYEVYHTYDSRRSQRGFPDLSMIRPPRLIFIEVKTEKGRLTRDQELWRDYLERCPGVEYYLCRPSNFDEIIEILRGQNQPSHV